MKTSFKKAFSSIVAGFLCLTSMPFAAAQLDANADASVGETLTLSGAGQYTGTCDGYHYEIWAADTPNTSTMTMGSGGAFSTSWKCGPSNSKGNFLARRGLFYGQNNSKHWQDYGNFTCDFDCEWSAGSAGNSRLCIYGWTQNPLVEYYIIEDWVNWVPSASNSGGTSKGTATIDGSVYDIFTCPRDSYTIEGNKPFTQYFSVRRDKRSKGLISIYKHFETWESLGMDMGGFYEVAFNVEGWESDGQANVKKNVITFDGEPGPTDPPKEPTDPDANGNYLVCDFETGKDSWTGRGDAAIATDSSTSYTGSQSLKITDRGDNWHGAAITLDSDAFVPGYTYSFDAAALQKSGSNVTLQLTLQQGSGDSATYTKIADVDAKSGEWSALTNTSFTIPSGSSDLLLYIESPDSLTDIWLDSVTIAVDGTPGKVVTGGGSEDPTDAPTKAPTQGPTDTPTKYLWGDANCDGQVTLNDAVAILQYVALPAKYKLTDLGKIQADVDGKEGISGTDALSIQKYDAKLIDSLPEGGVIFTPTTTATEKKTEPTVTTKAPVVAATLLSSSFDSGLDGWESRGGASVSADKESYYSSSQSIKVAGRSDTWQGIAYDLSSLVTAGETYSISAAVMQGSGSDVEMMLTLQYTVDGEDKYSNIATETVSSKTWTKLENTAYTIPAGATKPLLYVETSSSLTDFYLDDVLIASEGTKSTVTTGKGTVSENVGKVNTSSDVDISWIDPSKPMVAISFDDGAVGSAPTDYSMRIINAIADAGFHSTFFYVADWTSGASDEAEIKYAFSKGMEIANHSKTHPRLSTLSPDQIKYEWQACNDLLKGIIGTDPSKLMRLPNLDYNATVQQALSDVPLISCAVDTGDWNGASSQQIINKITTAMNDGSLKNAIVLCHETYDSTATAIEYLAPYLKQQGWQIVTVSEMFAVNGKPLNGGQVYTRCQ